MKKKKAAKKRPKATARPKARPKTRAKASATPKAAAKSRPRRSRVITAAKSHKGRMAGNESTQSGDTQGLSNRPGADSESVKELEEEGQYFEAEVVEGVEDAPVADAGPIKTREVPEDDVPEEYLDDDSRDRQS